MPFDTIRMGSSAAGAYEIERSLRFEGLKGGTAAGQLDRDFQAGGNAQKWTFAVWFKLTQEGTVGGNTVKHFIAPFRGGDGTNENVLGFDSANRFYMKDSGGGQLDLNSHRRFRDSAAWMHCVVAVDTTQGTAANRVKVYFNGVQETDFSTATYPSEDYNLGWNKEQKHSIGRYAYPGATSGANTRFNGYMADLYWIDNQQLTPSSFGKTDPNTGQFIPIEYKGTYGTTGFYLDFSDNSNTTSSTLGKDRSGNDNDWTPANFSVAAGVGDDSSLDTPTNNCCTFNTWDNGGLTVTNGGLDISGSTGDKHARAAWALPESGKYYWEVTATTVTAASYQGIGIAHSTYNVATSGFATDGSKMYAAGGEKYHDPDSGSWGDTWDDGDIISIAVDMDAGKIWAAKNGTWQESGNPATGANPMYDNFLAYSTDKQWHPSFHSFQDGAVASFNFGQRAFSHTVPTGYGPLSVATMPTPTIKNGEDYFKTILYTGNGTTDQSKTVGFQPDILWIKKRNNTDDHILTDNILTPPDYIKVNDYADAETYAEGIKSFNSTGFVLGNANNINQNTHTFVAWSWKESAVAGLDIVDYDGNGVAGRTVAHNLGVAPELIIAKVRDADRSWAVGGTGTWDINLRLESTAVGANVAQAKSQWNETAPTSSVFYVGDGDAGDYSGDTNVDGENYTAYCFASVAGYCKIGTYEGTGSASGPFVYTGFKPAYLLTKRIETSSNAYWNIFDNERQPYNSGVTADFKRIHISNSAEATNHANYTPPDFYSNGFRHQHGRADLNYSGQTFLYIAFAERPFQYANAQ